jgi:hypothetical protein
MMGIGFASFGFAGLSKRSEANHAADCGLTSPPGGLFAQGIGTDPPQRGA